MKILILTSTLEPRSGTGRYSGAIVRELGRYDLDYQVLVSDNAKISTDKESPVLRPFSLINFFKNTWQVRRLARAFDIIHAFDGWPYGVYGYLAVLGTKKKLFINGVGTYSVAPLARWPHCLLLSRAYQRSAEVFCISRYVVDQIVRFLPNIHTKVVHLGLTPLPSLSAVEVHQRAEFFKLGNHRPVILTVGEIKDRKGQLDTLRALALLKNDYPNWLYLMIGSDHDESYISKIKKFAADNNLSDQVKIFPRVGTDQDLAFFYQQCDVFALNSNSSGGHFEGFGLVLLEAAQFGKPVIGSRDSGIEDAVEDGYNGRLTNQRDEADIARVLRLILADPSSYTEASKEFASRFNWAKTVDAYYQSYIK